MFKRIDHIEIVTDRLDATVAFYTAVLGFKERERDRIARPGSDQALNLVYLDLGGTTVELIAFEGIPVALSASAGIAANPPHGTTAEELWRAAGEALMRAKRDGRDRVALHIEEKMVLKSNYYSKANLERLAKLSSATDRTEASLLREALDDLLYKHRDAL